MRSLRTATAEEPPLATREGPFAAAETQHAPPPPQKKTAVTTEADSKGQHLECQHGHDCYASSDMSPSLNHQGAVQKDGTWTGRASPAPLPPLPGRDGEDGRVILPLLEGG